MRVCVCVFQPVDIWVCVCVFLNTDECRGLSPFCFFCRLHANPELGGLGRDELGRVEGHEHVPLGGIHGAELLAAGAGAAAAKTHAVTNDVTAGAGLLSKVVAHNASGAGNAPHHQAVLDDSALLPKRGGVELAGRAGAAAPPAADAHQRALQVGAAAAGGELPALVERAGLTSPVDLVEAKDTLDASRLDLIDTSGHCC